MWAASSNLQAVLAALSHPGRAKGLSKSTQKLPKTSWRDQFYIYIYIYIYIYKLPINRTADVTGDDDKDDYDDDDDDDDDKDL